MRRREELLVHMPKNDDDVAEAVTIRGRTVYKLISGAGTSRPDPEMRV